MRYGRGSDPAGEPCRASSRKWKSDYLRARIPNLVLAGPMGVERLSELQRLLQVVAGRHMSKFTVFESL
jgi:hypothetical protein